MAQIKFAIFLQSLFCATLLCVSVIKLDYLFNVNINTLVLQVGAGSFAVLCLLKPIRVDKKLLLISSILFLLIIAFYNFFQPTALITNPLIPTFIFLLIFSTIEFRQKNIHVSRVSILIFALCVIVIHAAENMSFSPEEVGKARLSGLGSGTTYALTAAFMCCYFFREYSVKKIGLITFLSLIAVPIWSILLVQSRGVLLSIALIIIISNVKNIRGFLLLCTIFFPALVFIFQSEAVVSSIDVLSRIDYRNYEDLEHFTSGRIQTQVAIAAQVGMSAGTLQSFLGIEGINGLKLLVERGYFFPHFDLLYFIYDMGFIGALFYIFLSCAVLIRFRFNSFVLLYFISSLHTNMVLDPGFLILSILMSSRYGEAIDSNGRRVDRIDFPLSQSTKSQNSYG